LDWDISVQFDFIETPALRIPKDKRLQIQERLYKDFKDNETKTEKSMKKK